MMKPKPFSLSLIAFCLGFAVTNEQPCTAQSTTVANSPYSQWTQGPSTDPDFFPIAVWLQSPRNAEKYKAAGINTYVGLWKGPTEEQLAELKKAGMKVVCAQNEIGLNSPNNDIIIAWMHGDEPDNAQAKKGGGYGPPISPAKIKADYAELKKNDTTRPIFLNLGQGVAYDQYIGRGIRTNHPEDYREYIQGSDIVSFDIYPAVHDKPDVKGKLEFVPKGVSRLREWSDDKKIVWNCIEASRIDNLKVKPTPEQVRSEVWMSIIAGSRGVIYFVHQFQPKFSEASLLEDDELLNGITRINQRILKLAPVLNSPNVSGKAKLSVEEGKVQWMCKKHEGSLYLFMANQTETPIKTMVQFDNEINADALVLDHFDGSERPLNGSQLSVSLPKYGIALLQIRLK